MSAPNRAAIIGCGLIGRGWAAAFARAGWQVALWDRDPVAVASAADWMAVTLRHLNAEGLCPDPAMLHTPVLCDDLGAAIVGAVYVQESLPEDRDAKAAIFADLDRIAPPATLIGSSTSTLPGSTFLNTLSGRQRAMVAHPANPPHLMPVVELVPSDWHAEADIAAFRAAMEAIEQVPVVLNREIEGFVMNRLQTAVVNEAIALVAAGVIEPADLDRVMKHSLGLRWAMMGPFETMDLNAPSGFLDYATRYGRYYENIGRSLTVSAPWPGETIERIEAACRAALPAPEVANRMHWRDRALMQLLALRNREALS